MTLYEISVRQTRDLPVVSLFPHPASFRFHLTMDTLAFGYILPTTGWIRDFNPLETCAAGRTSTKTAAISASSTLHALSARKRAAGSRTEESGQNAAVTFPANYRLDMPAPLSMPGSMSISAPKDGLIKLLNSAVIPGRAWIRLSIPTVRMKKLFSNT